MRFRGSSIGSEDGCGSFQPKGGMTNATAGAAAHAMSTFLRKRAEAGGERARARVKRAGYVVRRTHSVVSG